MGILKLLYLSTLITFPLAQALRLQLPGDINVSAFDIAVMITGIVWLLYAALGKSDYQKQSLTKPMLLFLLVICISLVANSFRYPGNELFVAALYGIRWLLFASVYFVISDLPELWKKKIPGFLRLSGVSLVVLGYLQYFFYWDLRNLYYLGWDEHLFRMFSTFLDPNFFGSFLVLYFIFVTGCVTKLTKKDGWKRYVWGSVAVLTFTAIFLTTSRSAFIMLGVSLVVFLVLLGKKKYLFLFAAIAVLIFALSSRFFYLENINPFRVASSVARVESGVNAISIIAHNSLFGVGFNAYRYAQIEYGLRHSDPKYPSHADSGTDTSLLFVFATTGIVGLGAYLYLLNSFYREGKKADGVYRAVLLSSLVGILVNSLFINSLFYPSIMYWLFSIYAIRDYT